MSTHSPFDTFSWRSDDSSRTTVRRKSPETIQLPFRRRCRKKTKHFDVRTITHRSRFFLTSHRNNTLPPSYTVGETNDRLPTTTIRYPRPTDGIARVDSSPRPRTRDPDLAAAGDVTCAPPHRTLRILAEQPRHRRSRQRLKRFET